MVGLYNYNGKFEILYSLNSLKKNLHNIKLHDIIIDLQQFKLEYDQSICSICIEDFLKKNILTSLVIILKCKHVFHMNCFDKYFKTVILNENIKELYIRCPLCSDNIDKLDFLCCYKKMLEKIYNEKILENYNKKNKFIIFINLKRITRVKTHRRFSNNNKRSKFRVIKK
jgi:hypothetical protein